MSNSGNYNYDLRGLTENEISHWAKFCAHCFSYKPDPPPPSYFERHYYKDPLRRAEWILVAVERDTGNIVSSVRIFHRLVSILQRDTTSTVAVAGGIGEVCTLPTHRRLGLSTRLLTLALSIMSQESKNMEYSFLHASPEFHPFYNKLGFTAVPSHWSILKVYPNRQYVPWGDLKEHSLNFRSAQFPQDTRRLSKIHSTFSEKRFSGCIIRSDEYWNQYVQGEGSLYVLVEAKTNLICSWISFRTRPNNRYQVRDFGNDQAILSTGKSFYFLVRCFRDTIVQQKKQDEKTVFDLHLPTALLRDIKQSFSDLQEPNSFFDFDRSYTEDDNGWMWQPLIQRQEGGAVHIASDHLIWPLDSF
jgi:predicted GNAT family N-acyltransferase